MKLLKTTLFSIVIFFTLQINLFAQEADSVANNKPEEEYHFVMQKSPWGAVARSAVIPGLGQYYNESYWKIPVVWGFLGYYTYEWISSNDNYKKYKDLYKLSVTDGDANIFYYRLRESYKDRRDSFAVYFGIAYFLTLVDAYVDAHMFDFSVSEDNLTGQTQLNIRVGF